MTKLSDTQAIILGAAAQRDDRNILPLPGSLRGGAARNVVAALLKRGLIAEIATASGIETDAAQDHVWRNDADGCAVLLHVTGAGLAAIGVEAEGAGPDGGDTAPTGAREAPSAEAPENAPTARRTRRPRDARRGPAPSRRN